MICLSYEVRASLKYHLNMREVQLCILGPEEFTKDLLNRSGPRSFVLSNVDRAHFV